MRVLLLMVLNIITSTKNAGILGLVVMYVYYSIFKVVEPYENKSFAELEHLSIIAYIAILFLTVLGIGETSDLQGEIFFYAITLVGLYVFFRLFFISFTVFTSYLKERLKNWKFLKQKKKDSVQ